MSEIKTEQAIDILASGSGGIAKYTAWLVTAVSGAFIEENQLPEGIVDIRPAEKVVWSASGAGLAATGSFVVQRTTSAYASGTSFTAK